MISKVSSRVRKKMKFGIHLSATYEVKFQMYKESGNTFWSDATKKEMNNVKVAFKFLDDGTKMPIEFKKIVSLTES